MEKFSKSIKKEDFEEAMKLKQDLVENENVPQEELDKVKVTTNKIYKKNFALPEVAHNDYASEQLEELEIAEKNLNANMDNADLLKKFILVTKEVGKKLKEKYESQWNDPANGDAP